MKQLLLLFAAGLLIVNKTVFAGTSVTDGKAVFDRNCSVCHSINPPPKSAPPIVPLSSRYHQQFATRKEGVGHIAAFIKAPDKNKAIEPQAIARFGLMPPIALPENELQAVAGWIWDQYNPAMGGCISPGGQGRGTGPRNR